ncbi:MAG: type I DNA topoisomerase, partial [Pseudomonadota bacterium]
KYLGKDFRIMASVGHVKDLPGARLGVDTKNNFEPEYVAIKGKGRILKELKQAGRDADIIYLAPDPDREGEAIAWHIAQELKGKGKQILRVLFNEFTERAIKEALSSPQALNEGRFQSQQARRILDRLVGYQISPILWSRVRRGLSAGRVQSVALRMICDREREIYAFEPEEYWSLTAHLESNEPPAFKAKFQKYEGKKVDLKNEEQVQGIIGETKDEPFIVENITKKKKKKNPPPPFTTSLLQQEGYKKLRFPAKKTMFIAQNLYEGIELGDKGQVGLITYMRTDSFRLSEEALSEARKFITQKFGQDYLPGKPQFYRSRQGAQEAHEAIRPTSVELTPDELAPYLSKDQLLLYSLIWKRFLACQMNPALLEQTQADITAGKGTFRASGSIVVFDGFTTLYQEDPNGIETDTGGETLLPRLRKGQILRLLKLDPMQHFTQPPPRFSEATLIKALEENGIGRPSTYASILANIHGREYVTLDKGRFKPTELGFLVIHVLMKGFPEIIDIKFTAQMESGLDQIETGKIKWTKVLENFNMTFEKDLEKAQNGLKGEAEAGLSCPGCKKPLNIKSGRNGLFLGCSGYPECKYTNNFTRDDKGQILLEKSPDLGKKEGTCEKCGMPMVVKNGRYGAFLACSGYPECKNTRTRNGSASNADTQVPCPEEGCKGMIVERTSKKGKKFYACNQYPECRFVMWNEPMKGTCPQCGTPVFEIKRPARTEPVAKCRKRGCAHTQPLPS